MSARSAVKVVFARLCQKRSKRQLNEFQVVIGHSSALDADHREAELSLFSPSLNPLSGRLDEVRE